MGNSRKWKKIQSYFDLFSFRPLYIITRVLKLHFAYDIRMNDEVNNNDIYLWNLFLKGDDCAYTAIYEKYYKRVFFYCLSYKISLEEAKDWTHDIFFDLFFLRDRLPELINVPTSSVLKWIISFSRNRCRDRITKKKRREKLINEYFKSEWLFIHSSEIHLKHDLEIINKYIQELDNPEYRELILKLGEGLSNKEIAQKMGKSKNWVKSAKHEARKKLDQFLCKHRLN